MNKDLVIFAQKQVEIAMLQLNVTKSFFEKVKDDSLLTNNESEWVYIEKLAELTGLSINAIRNRVGRNDFLRDVHYRQEKPDVKKSRLIFNMVEINKYLSGS